MALDIQAYIASGILELYLMGSLSKEEEAEVEGVIAQHPEVKAELERIELSLEEYAQILSTPPPAGTLTNVLEKIPPKTVEMSRGRSGYAWAALAAAIALGLLALFTYQKRLDLQRQLTAQQDELLELQQNCDETSAQLQDRNAFIDLLLDPATSRVQMQGTDNAPQAIAEVYVNPGAQRALLNAGSLPEPPADKTYQLWALIDGQPIDMGIFAMEFTGENLLEVPFVEGAQAFAVTLEDAGGKPTPDLTQLYVIGNVG